jgi:photosystem II stability/assembly factor-like uncharacterized protein
MKPQIGCRWKVSINSVACLFLPVLVAAGPCLGQANVWTSAGLDSVGAFSLALAPTAPATLYAGTSYGVYKSNNGGTTWDAINIGRPETRVIALVVDPATPETVYSAGDGGVFRSTDSGASWTPASAGLPGPPSMVYPLLVSGLAIAPSAGNVLFASIPYFGAPDGEAGVYKSIDSGSLWSKTNTPDSSSPAGVLLAIDPRTPNTLYAGTSERIFKSIDGGDSWTAASTGLVDANVASLVIDSSTPATLYAVLNIGSPRCFAVFKSRDGAESWTALEIDLSTLCGGYGAPPVSVRIEPPDTVYVVSSTDVAFKSRDGGSSWNALNAGPPDIHIFFFGLVIDPTAPGRLYGASDGVFSLEHAGFCVGDCDGSGDVTVDEIIALVNIALGNAQPSACPFGVLSAAVDVALIVQAVSNAIGHGECRGI